MAEIWSIVSNIGWAIIFPTTNLIPTIDCHLSKPAPRREIWEDNVTLMSFTVFSWERHFLECQSHWHCSFELKEIMIQNIFVLCEYCFPGFKHFFSLYKPFNEKTSFTNICPSVFAPEIIVLVMIYILQLYVCRGQIPNTSNFDLFRIKAHTDWLHSVGQMQVRL